VALEDAEAEEETVEMDHIKYHLMVVSCRFMYSTNSNGQDQSNDHLEFSHFVEIQQVQMSECSSVRRNNFVPIIDGLKKFPSNLEIILRNIWK